MEGLERLEKEAKDMKNASITKLFEFLKTRKNLYENFENEEKTMKGMYEYLYEKARNHKVGNVAFVEDNLVYVWAVTYFLKSNEELGIKKNSVMPPSPKEIRKKLEEKKAKKDENLQINLFEEDKK